MIKRENISIKKAKGETAFHVLNNLGIIKKVVAKYSEGEFNVYEGNEKDSSLILTKKQPEAVEIFYDTENAEPTGRRDYSLVTIQNYDGDYYTPNGNRNNTIDHYEFNLVHWHTGEIKVHRVRHERDC